MRAEDAIDYLLVAFRSVREVVGDDPVIAIELFNLMLLAAARVKSGYLDPDELRTLGSVGELLRLISRNHSDDLQVAMSRDVTPAIGQRRLYATLSRFITPEPRFNYALDPLLLLRHASGDLYQEAHIALEESPQMTLAGIAPVKPSGAPRLGVRFTPPTLARALAEQAISAVDLSVEHLTILDPACGSGVFLIEATRELIRQGYRGRLKLRGIDVSEVSASMAKFCLKFVVDEAIAAGIDASATVLRANSLTQSWDDADVILMNPPFIPWMKIDEESKALVRAELADAAKGRTDLAMAFIIRAAKSLRPGGALSAVLPSPLLESMHGAAWRDQLSDLLDMRLIGRFEGYSYFRASMVEPAFLVGTRRTNHGDDAGKLQLLIARPGSEERSLRSLRAPEVLPSDVASWNLSIGTAEVLRRGKWMPRWPETAMLEDALIAAATPRAGDIFDVRQGALTGVNDAFLLDAKLFQQLPSGERVFFRPAAGTKNIAEGRIEPGHWVFYPYENGQITLRTEQELRAAVPDYFERFLFPQREKLAARKDIDLWWSLTRSRSWQRPGEPKLVSSYFGKRGGFAYDQDGSFTVVHGYAWLWNAHRTQLELVDDDTFPVTAEFTEGIAFAYLAILNSSIFEQLLALYCPRIAGTQFNLSKRFVAQVFVPDLTDELTPPHTIDRLARLGRLIHHGAEIGNQQELDNEVATAYRLKLDVFEAAARF